MNIISLALCFALVVNCNGAVNIFQESEADIEIGPVECTVYLMQKFASDPAKQNEMKPDCICEIESNALDGTMERLSYILDGLDDKFYKTVEFGEKVTIQKAIVNGNTLTVYPDKSGKVSVTVLKRQNNKARKRPPVTGNGRIIVIYVNALDAQNDEVSYEELGDKVFGSDGDPVNARSQLLACSKNQLNYFPACSRPKDKCYGDTDFKNGVLKVNLNKNVTGVGYNKVYYWAANAAGRKLDKKGLYLNIFTQQMFVYPSEVGGPVAWAGGGWFGDVTGFQDTYAYPMGVQVHELCHNIGFDHSGYGSNAYGDHSCLMGNPSWGDDGPQICFNGVKSWQSTWYDEDSVQVDVLKGQSFVGDLVGVGDWAEDRFTSGKHNVVIKIPRRNKWYENYYVIFNRAKGPNNGVTFFADLVHITTEDGSGSSHEGSLNSTETFTKTNFGNSGNDLKVHVCDIDIINDENEPDIASVLVYLDDGTNNNPVCGQTQPTCRSIGTYNHLRKKYCKGRGNKKELKFPRHWKIPPGPQQDVLTKQCEEAQCKKKDCCTLGPMRKCSNTGDKGLIKGGFTQKMCGEKLRLKGHKGLKKSPCTTKKGTCTKANCCVPKD